MINLLVYTSASRQWASTTDESYVKIQIENSLQFGWKTSNIVLATNFPYEYLGVKSIHVDGMCEFHPRNNKTWVMHELCDRLEGPVWCHDNDAFQVAHFELPQFGDIGMVQYGTWSLINGGVVFYRPAAKDLFADVMARVIARRDGGRSTSEEPGYMEVWKAHKDRFTIIDSSYNVGITKFSKRYGMAKRPVKIVHFHPNRTTRWDKFVLGRNDAREVLVPPTLAALFVKYEVDPINRRQRQAEPGANPSRRTGDGGAC